jgi:iron(III) transport system substrate-binding protein
MEALHREQLLQQVRSPAHGDIMPQAIPTHKEWVGSTLDIFVQAYNTNKVKKEELPKSYQDLLDPKWKGRLGIEGEDQHWFALLVQELGQEKGTKLFKDIVDANGISVRKGHSLLANLVASGEVPLGLTLYNYAPEQLKQKGAPIQSFIIPPAIAQFRAVGLLKKAPHPHAAMLWYDFMLSEEGQQILTKRFNIPTSKMIDTPEKSLPLKFIDPAQFLDMNEKWVKAYEEAVTKRVKP